MNAPSLSSQLGAALVELSISIVVLLIFLSGILVLGNLFIQSSWLNQSIYQLTYASSSIGDASERTARLQSKANSLISLQKELYTNKSLSNFSINVQENVDTFSANAVSTSAPPEARTLKRLSITLESNITAPWNHAIHTFGPSASTTIRDTKSFVPTELQSFANPPTLYDCEGAPCPSSEPCATSCFDCSGITDTECPLR